MPSQVKQYCREIQSGTTLRANIIRSQSGGALELYNGDLTQSIKVNSLNVVVNATDIYLTNQVSINPVKTDITGKIIP